VHFADLLWHCSSGGGGGGGGGSGSGGGASASGPAAAAPAAPALWPPWDAPLRPHLLLSHATALPTYGPQLAHAALTYALAAFPQAALRACGVPPALYAPELAAAAPPPPPRAPSLATAFAPQGSAAAAPVDFCALAEGLAATGAHSLSPAARAAKLAMLSGSAAGAGGVLEHLLLQLGGGAEEERGALAAVRACARAGCSGAGARLAAAWVQRCLAGGRSGLGSALAWALGLRGCAPAASGALRAVAARCARHLHAAVRGALCGELAGACVMGAPAPSASALRPWFPAPGLLAGRLEAFCSALGEGGGLGAVDEALAAVGHDGWDGEVVEGRALSNSAALARGASAEPLLRHALLLRRFLGRLQALSCGGGDVRGDVRDALSDLRELAAAPAQAATLAQDGDSARLLRAAGALGLLAGGGGGGGGSAGARQALLALVLAEERRLAEALFEAALREGSGGGGGGGGGGSGAGSGAGAGPLDSLEALVDQPLGVWGLGELKRQLQ
jgi:hypothetical protein